MAVDQAGRFVGYNSYLDISWDLITLAGSPG